MATFATHAASASLWPLYFEHETQYNIENGRLALIDGLVNWWLEPDVPFFRNVCQLITETARIFRMDLLRKP